MEPGNYDFEELEEGSRLIEISGSGNTINLTGFYIQVPVGSVKTTYFFVSGDNTIVIGGEFEDVYRNRMT